MLITWLLSMACRVAGQGLPEGRGDLRRPSPSIDETLLFWPSRFPEGDWSPQGLRFDDVFFEAADRTRLHGWYCQAERPRAVLLLAHGNAGHVASRASWLKYLQQTARLSVFAFDYRGYGRSEGTPSVAGALLDARAARAKLCELASVQDSQLVLMGESLGGAIVVQLAAESSPRGLVLQSTFGSMREVAQVHYPNLAWLVPENKLNSVRTIAAYRGPLFQSHGDRDETIPVASGRRLFDAAPGPKQWVTIEMADHNDWITEDYLRRLNQFFEALP